MTDEKDPEESSDHFLDEENYETDEPNVDILLYLGFILLAIGVIITSVGVGEKGFKTLELQMLGPTLLGLGVMFVLLRVLFCSCPCLHPTEPDPSDEETSDTVFGSTEVMLPLRQTSQTVKKENPTMIDSSALEADETFMTSPLSCIDLDEGFIKISERKVIMDYRCLE